MSGLTVLMRIDGGRAVGLGHLMRAFALARHIVRAGGRAIFVSRANPHLYGLFAPTPHRVYYLPATARETTIAREVRRLDLCRHVDVISIDLPTDLTADELDAWNSTGAPVVLFDDHGPASRQAALTINAIAHPDHLAARTAAANGCLNGPAYIVLDDAYRDAPKSGFRDTPSKILIAMGGADPHNISEAAVRALMPLAEDHAVHLLLGPAYGFRPEVEAAIAESRRPVTIEQGIPPAEIPGYLAGFDLAIMSFGITVYGAAHLGLPVITLGHDDAGARAGEVLERTVGCVRALGRHDLVSGQNILRETEALLADAGRRKAMREKGMAAVDGNSTERIIAHFGRLARSRG